MPISKAIGTSLIRILLFLLLTIDTGGLVKPVKGSIISLTGRVTDNLLSREDMLIILAPKHY